MTLNNTIASYDFLVVFIVLRMKLKEIKYNNQIKNVFFLFIRACLIVI